MHLRPRWFTRSLGTLPVLFLAAMLSGCGAPVTEEDLEAENAAEALNRPCIKGEPCDPVVPLPPPAPKPIHRTYCCDYGTIIHWYTDKDGRKRAGQIEGYGCRDKDESKDKRCRLDLQITCNGFRVERLSGGHLLCDDPI